MTFHVAVASKVGAVMISDSQGSAGTSESHGHQKQVACANFLGGVAGNSLVCDALLFHLASSTTLKASDLEKTLTTFIQQELFPSVIHTFGALFVVPSSAGYSVRKFEPGTFKKLGPETTEGTIGTGAEFAKRAVSRNDELGIVEARTDLVDLFFCAESQACAANESLTVDDQLLVGVLHNGKSYLMGHEDLRVSAGPQEIRDNWVKAATTYQEIRAMASAMRGELREAHREFSIIRSGAGALSAPVIQKLQEYAKQVQKERTRLADALVAYCKWYDGLLKR